MGQWGRESNGSGVLAKMLLNLYKIMYLLAVGGVGGFRILSISLVY